MTGPPELRVHGDAIRADATKIENVTFRTPTARVNAPCGLTPASSAADAFNKAAGQDGLLGDQKKLLELQKQIVASMRTAAEAYDDVDYWASRNIDIGVGAPPGTPQMTADPAGMPPASSIGEAAGSDFLLPVCFAGDTYSDIEAAQAAMTAPDDCASLLAAMDEWTDVAASLNAAALELPTAPSHWDGTAAPQAYARVAELKQNLITLATAWMTLAGRANGFAAAHRTLKAGHTEVYQAYKINEGLAKANPGNNHQYFAAMAEQIAASEEIRDQYGKACELPRGPLPPVSARTLGPGPGMPGPGGGSPSSWPVSEASSGGGSPSAATASGGGASSSGGGRPGGPPAQGLGASAAQQGAAAAKPQSGEGADAKQPTGGQSSGGQPPGGSPTGGMPGGMPGGLPSDAGRTGAPRSPSVRPASAGGAGKGGGAKAGGGAGKAGGGAGRGGGGMGGKPLSPAVTAEGVAAARGAGPGPGSAETGRAPVGGGAAGECR